MTTQKKSNIILIGITAILLIISAGCSNGDSVNYKSTNKQFTTIDLQEKVNGNSLYAFRDEQSGCRYLVLEYQGKVTMTPQLNPQGKPQCGGND